MPGGGNPDYSSLITWEDVSDNDLAGYTGPVILDCYDSQDHDNYVLLHHATNTSSTVYRHIRSSPSCTNPWAGKKGTGANFISSSVVSANLFQNAEPYGRFSDFYVELSVNNESAFNVVGMPYAAQHVGRQVINVRAKCTNAGAGGGRAFYVQYQPAFFYNCIGEATTWAFYWDDNWGYNAFINCINAGSGNGFYSTNNGIAWNCYSASSAAGGKEFQGTFSTGSGWCASKQTTAGYEASKVNSLYYKNGLDLVTSGKLDADFLATADDLFDDPSFVGDLFTGDDGDAIDSSLWDVTGSPDIQNNTAEITNSEKLVWKTTYTEDFNAEVDFALQSPPATDSYGADLLFNIGADIDIYARAARYSGGKYWQIGYRNGGAWTYEGSARTNDSGKLRITRTGTSYAASVVDGSGNTWLPKATQVLGSAGDTVTISLVIARWDASPSLTCRFDNFDTSYVAVGYGRNPYDDVVAARGDFYDFLKNDTDGDPLSKKDIRGTDRPTPDTADCSWNVGACQFVSAEEGITFRIRILVDATGDLPSSDFQLEYRRKPYGGAFGSWGKVNPE